MVIRIKKLYPEVLFLIALILTYAIIAVQKTALHFSIAETDTQAFFWFARKISESDSVFKFIISMYTGVFEHANRHPLFPMLMNIFIEDGINWFIKIKIFNIILGLVFVLIFYFIIKKEAGIVAASISAFLLIFNDTFIFQSTMVSSEPLLLIFSFMSFYFLYKGLDDSRLWLLAAVCLGLTFLTKVSALFIVMGFALFLFFNVKGRFWTLLNNRNLWLFAVIFAIIISPILVRNTIVYKFPFYNENIDYLAMDRADWFAGEYLPDFTDLFEQNILYFVKRFFFGLYEETKQLIYSLYTFFIYYRVKFVSNPYTWFEKFLGAFSGIIVFISAIFGFVKIQVSSEKKRLILFLFFSFFLPLSWYSITSPHKRYCLPLTVYLIFFASCGIIIFLKSIMVQRHIKVYFKNYLIKINTQVLISVVMFIFSVCMIWNNGLVSPYNSIKIEDGYFEIADYLNAKLSKGEYYYKRGGHTYTYHIDNPELEMKSVSKRVLYSYDEFVLIMKSFPKIRYILIDSETYHFSSQAVKGYITKEKKDKYINLGDSTGLLLIKDIPGWKVVMMDDNPPYDYILFERIESTEKKLLE